MCGLTINAVQGLTATFNYKPVRVIAPPSVPAYFNTLAAAYAAAPNGATIQTQVSTFLEALTLNRPITLTLDGGKDIGYMTTVSVTTVQGSLTVSQGQVIISDVVIK